MSRSCQKQPIDQRYASSHIVIHCTYMLFVSMSTSQIFTGCHLLSSLCSCRCDLCLLQSYVQTHPTITEHCQLLMRDSICCICIKTWFCCCFMRMRVTLCSSSMLASCFSISLTCTCCNSARAPLYIRGQVNSRLIQMVTSITFFSRRGISSESLCTSVANELTCNKGYLAVIQRYAIFEETAELLH